MSRSVYIAGTGSFLPGDPIPWEDHEKVLGALNEAPASIRRWIERSAPVMAEILDIEFVHYAMDPETREFTEDNVSMSVAAARDALAMAGIEPADVDLLCYGSAHQDQMPTASAVIQDRLGIETCDEFGIHANCTSAYKALYLAHRLVESGRNETAVAISSSMSSSELRSEYYNQDLLDRESLFLRWFLSDGAGAVVLTSDPERSCGHVMEATYVESLAGRKPSLMFNRRPALWLDPRVEWQGGLHHLRQRFRNELSSEIFQEPEGSVFFKGLRRMVEKEGIPLDRVKLFQVNMPTRHIVDSIMDECETIGIARSCLYSKLDRLGYCGPPMAFVCLDRIMREEELEPGDRVLSFVTEVSKFMQAGYCTRQV